MNEEMDEYKKYIENLFNQKTPNEMPNDGHITEFCKKKALEELEQIRLAFIEFQTSISDLALAQYFDSKIDDFAQHAVSLNDIIEDDMNVDSLNPNALFKYKRLKQLRAQIFSDIYMKYNIEKY